MRLDCQLLDEPTGNRLTDTFISHFSSVTALYDGQIPTDLDIYQSRAARLDSYFNAVHRRALADALVDYGRRIGAPELSLAAAASLAQPQTLAVVTGQQAGLFTGPLFAVAKALTAIGVAKSMKAALGRNVVAVFWVASEDHDAAEVNHAHLLGDEDEVVRITLGTRFEPHQMVYHKPLLDAEVESVLQQVYQALPPAPHNLELIETLKSTWHPNDSLATWFARLMHHLLRKHALVMLDPCLPALRQLIQPVWVHALEHHEEVASSVAKAYAEVESHGFQPEVVRDESNSTLFYVEDGRRYVLERIGQNRLRARGLGLEQSVAAWVQMAKNDATAFSSNVLLRPVVQDYLLPTLAYVGGPSELAYFPLSRGVFHAHHRDLPPLILRQRLMIVPPAVARHASTWNVSLQDLPSTRNLVSQLIAKSGGSDLERRIDHIQAEVAQMWGALATDFAVRYPQTTDIVAGHLKRSSESAARATRKLEQLIRSHHDASVRQLRAIERWLWTDGVQQERRLSVLNLWGQFGATWFSELPTWGDVLVSRSPLMQLFH